ncbi:MAG: hypothetical protein LW832_03165 [Parachlamydia sp.]|nr:hypothetical protein [Parachlamydia sp.]
MFLFNAGLYAMDGDQLKRWAGSVRPPFAYNLNLTAVPKSQKESDVLVTMHGIGGDYRIAEIVRSNSEIPYHLVTFNFPDHDLKKSEWTKTSLGTIEEILPALYVWKQLVVDAGLDKLHLYGFSAGGGAIVNGLAVLNSSLYDKRLQDVGIGAVEKRKILHAVERGSIILEVPLKSYDEMALLWQSPEVYGLAARARKNQLVPLDNLALLKGLHLNAYVYFASRDEVIGNRDDQLFIQKFKQANSQGKITSLIGPTAGHNQFHPELWEAYSPGSY